MQFRVSVIYYIHPHPLSFLMNYSAPRGWLYGFLAVPIGSNAGRLTVSLSSSALNWIEQIASDTGETKSNVVAALLEYAKKASDNQYVHVLQRNSDLTNRTMSELDDEYHEYYATKYNLYSSSIGQEVLAQQDGQDDNS